MKPTLIMLCGLPGSGKSKAAEEYSYCFPVMIHSSDALRKEMFGDENCQDKNNELFNELHSRIKKDLLDGRDVIYDACNIHSKFRMAFLNSIRKIDCCKEAWIIATPYEICLRNNWMRERKIPDAVIDRMYRNWQTPWYFEGWDSIKAFNNYKGYYDLLTKTKWTRFNQYNQNNPYHTKTLGDHLFAAEEYIKNYSDDDNLARAALMHDFGKPYCRFEDKVGISHYYDHENVGAYDALSIYCQPVEVSALINYHMHPIHWENVKDYDKVCDKWRKIWGTDFFDKIMLLHEADEASR